MKRPLKIDEEYIRSRLPKDLQDQPINCFHGMFVEGLTVFHEGERGQKDIVIYRAENKDDLRCWQIEQVCYSLRDKNPQAKKIWRYERDHAENGNWLYIEHLYYDYNAIEDSRLCGFECFLRNLKQSVPPERWEKAVQKYTARMNRWYQIPHWDYDRTNLRFIEISDSKEYDSENDPVEEPRPGSIIKVIH